MLVRAVLITLKFPSTKRSASLSVIEGSLLLSDALSLVANQFAGFKYSWIDFFMSSEAATCDCLSLAGSFYI